MLFTQSAPRQSEEMTSARISRPQTDKECRQAAISPSGHTVVFWTSAYGLKELATLKVDRYMEFILSRHWSYPFKKAFKAACYLVAHFLVATLIIAMMAGVQHVLALDGDPKLFDFCPVRYIFDGVDIAILAVFVVFGTKEAIEVFRENDDD